MSVEALDFNVYLTGYDVQTIGMGLIIRDGILPVTSYDDSPIGALLPGLRPRQLPAVRVDPAVRRRRRSTPTSWTTCSRS